MGLLDAFKNMMEQPSAKATPAPSQSKPAPAPIKSAPVASPDTFKVKFSDNMPYYDPEFGSVEVMFNGFAEVKSESWAKDPKGQDFVSSIITMSIKKELMACGNDKVSYKDLNRQVISINKACSDALKEKNIEAKSINIASITLTAESRQAVDKARKAKELG